MDVLKELINQLNPHAFPVLKERAQVLKVVDDHAPIGRRLLAKKTGLSESKLRQELSFFKKENFVYSTHVGMTLTSKGRHILELYEVFYSQQKTADEKIENLVQQLNIESIHILAGDSDQNPNILDKMGSKAIEVLDTLLPRKHLVIAAMGGTTIAAMADRMTEDFSEGRDLVFVPGRGGIGEAMAIQANTICSLMAEKTGGESHALYTPDQITPETYSYLAAEPSVNQVLTLLDEAEVLLLGIGDAQKMSERRHVSPEIEAKLNKNGAVGEALGEYFDKDGNRIHELSKIGLGVEDLENIKVPLAIAGGKGKATSILAFLKNVPRDIHLVTDEGAVNEMLRLMDFD